MCFHKSAKWIFGFLILSLPLAKLANCPIQVSKVLLVSSSLIQAPVTTPGESGVTPSRAASGFDNIEVLDPESSAARTGLPLIATVRRIREPASIGTSPAGSVAQYASDTPSQSLVS